MIYILAFGAALIILLALPALIIGRWTALMVRYLEKSTTAKNRVTVRAKGDDP